METEKIPKGDDNSSLEKERLTDMEVALVLIGHINNPCTVEVAPGRTENIREFYITLAKNVMDRIANPEARRLLEMKIEEYKNN